MDTADADVGADWPPPSNKDFSTDEQADHQPKLFQIRDVSYWDEPREEVLRNCASPEQVLTKVKDALHSHEQLQHYNKSLQAAIGNGTCDVDQVQAALTENEAAMATIKDFLDACLDSFPTRMRPTDESHLPATRVFNTAELLEAILLDLEPSDIFNGMRINRTTMQLFEDSPKLQDKLLLRSRTDNNFSSLSRHDLPGLVVEVDGDAADQDLRSVGIGLDFDQVSLLVRFNSRQNFSIGARCRSMLVAQPPVTSMKVTVSCCPKQRRTTSDGWGNARAHAVVQFAGIPDIIGERWQSESDQGDTDSDGDGRDRDDMDMVDAQNEERTSSNSSESEDADVSFNKSVASTLEIRCRSGITVGQVQDATERIRAAHRNCAYAEVHEHDSNGIVWPQITFAAVLTLPNKTDPYLIQKDVSEVRKRLGRVSSDCHLEVMQIYVDTKKQAVQKGWPVLTFQQFKKRYGVHDFNGWDRPGEGGCWDRFSEGEWGDVP